MIIKKENRIKGENSPKCIYYEYPTKDKDLDASLIEINGRYPDKGCVTNEICKEIIFIVSGKGKIVIDGKECFFNDEDVLLVLPKQKYFFEGKFKMLASCTPAWHPEQHKYVE